MGYWAKAAMGRDQAVLFATTLGDRIPDDHVVRLFWELLETYDWKQWEACYNGRIGQPPIHPRIVAGVLLYGLTQGIRSSRKLEWACSNAIDFMWLTENRMIDHTTLSEFRRRFGSELKDLFRHLGRLAVTMGVVRLNCVAIDGTRVAANANRFETQTASSLEAQLSALDEQIAQMLAEAEAVDKQASSLFGEDQASVSSVPKSLKDIKARQAKIQAALDRLQESNRDNPKASVTDPDAPVLLNKDGGVRPNYTPTNAIDTEARFITAEAVQGDEPESHAMPTLLDDMAETFEASPETMVADSLYCTDANLTDLEGRETDPYIAPYGQRITGPKQTSITQPNVAHRDNPQEPVRSELWSLLPRTRQGRIAREAFLYDIENDCYWCPMGKPAQLQWYDTDRRAGKEIVRRVYVCRDCHDCPLQSDCADGKCMRRIRSRGRLPLREKMTAKVMSDEGRRVYRQRMPAAEGPFGVIKSVLGMRQFLLRGLDRVRTEWRWMCTAYNLRVLIRKVHCNRAMAF